MAVSNRNAKIAEQCVACGNCVKKCPQSAISVFKGMYAAVDVKKCIGCGICVKACPASVISIVTREGQRNEN